MSTAPRCVSWFPLYSSLLLSLHHLASLPLWEIICITQTRNPVRLYSHTDLNVVMVMVKTYSHTALKKAACAHWAMNIISFSLRNKSCCCCYISHADSRWEQQHLDPFIDSAGSISLSYQTFLFWQFNRFWWPLLHYQPGQKGAALAACWPRKWASISMGISAIHLISLHCSYTGVVFGNGTMVGGGCGRRRLTWQRCIAGKALHETGKDTRPNENKWHSSKSSSPC